METKRKIALVANFVSYKEAEENDDLYFAKMSAEELLKECFDLRKLNYFNGKETGLPRIKKVGRLINKGEYEEHDA